MMKYIMEKNTSESEKENMVIWRIQFDHHMFRLCKNEIDFMLLQNLYAF